MQSVDAVLGQAAADLDAMRDTKDRAGAALTFGPGAWRQFAATIKDARKA